MADQKKLGDIKVKVDLDSQTKSFRKQTKKLSNDIKVGKSILELLTTAMYASPLTIYREYIQNAVDSIDQARNMNLYKLSSDEPRVSINIDRQKRTVSILDTGTGIKTLDFEEVLTSFGNSPKRKQKARGFRGIGRLAGLAYCKELIFRTKASDELFVNEIKWDCMKLRSLLIDASDECTLNEIVHQITEVSSIEYDPSLPNRFFEVILNGVQPIKNDILLNNDLIERYISEICPVPFKNSFKYRTEIINWLEGESYHEYKVYLNDSDLPITRPYNNEFNISKDKLDHIKDIELIELKTNQGDILAKGFVLHHDYLGAISDNTINGLRIRSGNIQVGGNDEFRSLFKQERFNSWCIGEFHILDNRIKANGRRDGFEHNKFYYNFLDYLKPVSLKLSKIIEDTSRERNKAKQKDNVHKFMTKKDKAIEKIEILIKKNDIPTDISKKIISIINKEI